MDRLPAQLLPAAPGARAPLLSSVPGYLEKAFEADELSIFGALAPLGDRCVLLHQLRPARKSKRVVYAKPPSAGPEQVLAYVARYTQRVAISNDRSIGIGDGRVRFR